MRYRGTDWMPEPCRSCERREIDWGGCRCQAFALTGDAAAPDPACALSPHRGILESAMAAGDDAAAFVHRGLGAARRKANEGRGGGVGERDRARERRGGQEWGRSDSGGGWPDH